jgi:hypothetical protein
MSPLREMEWMETLVPIFPTVYNRRPDDEMTCCNRATVMQRDAA